eukprot:8620946-Lingulodinium_polyedra.AAC.1
MADAFIAAGFTQPAQEFVAAVAGWQAKARAEHGVRDSAWFITWSVRQLAKGSWTDAVAAFNNVGHWTA